MFRSIMIRLLVLISFLLASTAGFGVQLKPVLEGHDQVRFEKYLGCVSQAEVIVNSQALKEKILAFKFTTTTKTPAEIITDMENGSEILSPASDGVWNWSVGFYRKKASKVIGWTNAKTSIVWINTAKFDTYKCPPIMANIVHEYLHKIRYGHKSAKDHSSVPYAIGYMVEAIAKNPAPVIAPQPKIKPLPVQPKKPRKSFWNRLRSLIDL